MQRQIKELKDRTSQEAPVIDDLKNIAAAHPHFEKLSNGRAMNGYFSQSFSVNLQTNQRSFGKSSQDSQCLPNAPGAPWHAHQPPWWRRTKCAGRQPCTV